MPPPAAQWDALPGVPGEEWRAAFRRRHPHGDAPRSMLARTRPHGATADERGTGHGLLIVPPAVRTEGQVLDARAWRGLTTAPVDAAAHAQHRAEWQRRDALPSMGRGA
ncbi:MAG TPA: hypothetical protein VGD56_19170 [Gemmatirosa sp.]